MAKEPDGLTIHILREIQVTLADHTRRFEAIDRRFDNMERGVREMRESTVTALGFAGHATVRNESLERRVDELERRIGTLETTRS